MKAEAGMIIWGSFFGRRFVFFRPHAADLNIITPSLIQGPLCTATLPPEGHRRRRQITGRLLFEGDTALLPNGFGDVQ